MSQFTEFFEALKESISNDEFVKLTLSKPIKKSEGLLNIYMRLLMVDRKIALEFKYRFASGDNKYKQFFR